MLDLWGCLSGRSYFLIIYYFVNPVSWRLSECHDPALLPCRKLHRHLAATMYRAQHVWVHWDMRDGWVGNSSSPEAWAWSLDCFFVPANWWTLPPALQLAKTGMKWSDGWKIRSSIFFPYIYLLQIHARNLANQNVAPCRAWRRLFCSSFWIPGINESPAFASLNAALQYGSIYRGDILKARRWWSSVTFSDPSKATVDRRGRASIGGWAEAMRKLSHLKYLSDAESHKVFQCARWMDASKWQLAGVWTQVPAGASIILAVPSGKKNWHNENMAWSCRW